MPSNQFEQRMRERLGRVEIPPRPEVWTQLEERLRREDRRGGFLWLFWDSTLAVLLLLSGFVWGESEMNKASLAFAPPAAHSIAAPFSDVVQEDTLACEDTQIEDTPITLTTLPVRHMRQVMHVTVPQNPQLTQKIQGAYPGSEPEARQHAPAKQPVLQATSDPQTREVSAAKTPSGQVAPIAAPIAVDLSVPPAAPAVAHKDIHLKNPSRWAWRFSLTPERVFGEGSQRLNGQPLTPSTDGLGAYFNDRTQSSNVVYGNYLPPNDSAYYLIAYPENALTASVQAEYFLRPRLSIQSGLSLTVFDGGQYEEGILADPPQTDPLTGIPNTSNDPNPNIAAATGFHTLQAGLPLQLNYYLRRGMSSWVLSGGVSLAQQFSWGTSHSNTDQETDFDPGGQPVSESKAGAFYARSPQSHATFRLLYERQVSSRTAWYIGPSFKYRLNSAPAGTLGQSPLRYRAGLEMGIRLGPGR